MTYQERVLLKALGKWSSCLLKFKRIDRLVKKFPGKHSFYEEHQWNENHLDEAEQELLRAFEAFELVGE